MGKLKNCVSALCLVSMLLTAAVPVMAAEEKTQVQSPVITETLTIHKAIEYAKENSYSLVSLKHSEEAAKYNEEAARVSYKNSRKTKEYGMMVLGTVDSLLLSSGYYYRASQFQHRMAKRDIITAEYTLESDIELVFYTYISAVKKTEIAENDVKSAQERLDFAENKYSMGAISALDRDSFKIALTEAKNNLSAAQRNEETALLNLKSVMNYPLDAQLKVYGEFTRHEMEKTTVEEALKLYQDTVEKANIDENFELATEKYNTAITFYTAGRYEFFAEKASYALAQEQYNKADDGARINIQNAYNQMVTMYETLAYLDETLKYTQANVNAAKLMYEQGAMTASDYLDTVSQFTQLQNTMADTELGAWNAVMAYRKTFDIKNTVFKE